MKNNIETLYDLKKERELIHQKIEVDKLKIIKEIDELKFKLTKSLISNGIKKLSSIFNSNKKH